MADDHTGQRKESKAPWTKIFTGFKVALDLKKLLLAGAGILAMAAGWWLLAVIFYNLRSEPTADYYLANLKTTEEKDEAWKALKLARARWNLLYEMAGPEETKKEDAVDVADSWAEYEEIQAIKFQHEGDKKNEPKSLEDIQKEIKAREGDKKKLGEDALYQYAYVLKKGKTKPHGRLRTWPWFEERGANPYLVVTENIKQANVEGAPAAPWVGSRLVTWLIRDEFPVLIEPLIKFLKPIAYFFDSRAGGWGNRIYLICVILWTIAVWGFFGGAITRMAAVQVARNEKISMGEALRFARERFQSFFSAPVFPLIFLGVLTFILILFGLFSGLIPILGDVLISGLLWPIVLLIGLVMAVVVVGLFGWPLMNPTISTEGSDSFDALSRSYSYIYQAPWHYIWYSFVALVYGAALVFFVNLMGSLMIFLGQWGVSQTPFLASSDPARDREPTYLFVYAPTSFGWRDLLIHSSPFAEPKKNVPPSGNPTTSYELRKSYMAEMKSWNYVGAILVTIWLYLLFLLIVGFGYSYFWTASTIIYLLMRHKVDDTDLDEIHLEAEETDEGFAKDTTGMPPAPAKESAAPNVTMVESPTLRTTPPAEGPAIVVSPGTEPTPENKPSGDGTAPPPAANP